MNRDKKNKNVNSPRHGEVKQASGCHGVLRWAQIVFFSYGTAKTRHTSPKRFLHQKNEQMRFYKSLQRAPQNKKWEKLILCPEVTRHHEHATCPQSAFFIKKAEKTVL